MAILDIFRDIAPEFENETDEKILRFIGYASPKVSEVQFGDNYELAVAYLAADMLAISKRKSSAITGEITALREGDLAKQYAVPQPSDGSFVTTYGQKFAWLCKLHIIPIFVTHETET
jgi:hypothetical protein